MNTYLEKRSRILGFTFQHPRHRAAPQLQGPREASSIAISDIVSIKTLVQLNSDRAVGHTFLH